MFLLEFNEFNFALVQRVAADAGLKNLSAILDWPRTITTTEDRDESGFLEPWAQWVSVHTGQPCSRHNIKHLGDVPDLGIHQLWERLDALGVPTGVWGVMNGSRGKANDCAFFLPDPWTFSEPAYPASLAPLLELPRYLARNYLHISKRKIAGLFGSFVSAVIGAIGTRKFLASLGILTDGFAKFGPRNLVFIAWFEYVSSLACLQLYKKHQPQFCLLFVNTIAHVQHHYWRDRETGSREILFALTVMDRLVEEILKTVQPTCPMIVTNGLSQKNTGEEPPWILYRQKDPEGFVRAAGLQPVSVEPLMSYDAHIVFASSDDCAKAAAALAAATVDDKPAFFVERNALDLTKLFYRIDFTDPVTRSTTIAINGKRFAFLSLFEKIVQRTGRHIPSGVALARGIKLPQKIENHQLCDIIISIYEPPSVETRQSA
jgi:hypothetical protein